MQYKVAALALYHTPLPARILLSSHHAGPSEMLWFTHPLVCYGLSAVSMWAPREEGPGRLSDSSTPCPEQHLAHEAC